MRRVGLGGEEGLTLIELLVAAAMSVVLVGAAGSMLISAVRTQPQISERTQSISTARWVLERMTREIRNGIVVYEATGPRVSFKTQVRRTACGAGVQEEASKPAIQCRVTYSCTTTACTRTETEPDVALGGTPTTIVSGLGSANVFNYSPDVEAPTYIGVTLRIPNPSGSGQLVVSDGAGLRTLSLDN
jgi:type II secretory pathway pseudopilin PulG